MKSFKSLKIIFLLVAGGFYFSFFSILNINPFFKSYAVIIPIQIAALVYGLYLIKNNKSSFSKPCIKE